MLVAFNLRTAVASLSPILHQLERDIAARPARVGLLGMLPPLCYAVFGIITPLITKRFDLEPTLVVALVALSLGLARSGARGRRRSG